jgi:hypothetical protein
MDSGEATKKFSRHIEPGTKNTLTRAQENGHRSGGRTLNDGNGRRHKDQTPTVGETQRKQHRLRTAVGKAFANQVVCYFFDS